MQRARMLRVARDHVLGERRRSRRCRRAGGRRASSSPTAAGPSSTRRRASRCRGHRGTARALRAWRRRRPGRWRRGARPCPSSARSSASISAARAAWPRLAATCAFCTSSAPCGSSFGLHQRVDVRAEHQRLAPVGHRQRRIEPRRLAEGAAGLGVVEGVGEVQALVHERLGVGVLGRHREVCEPRDCSRGASSPLGPGWAASGGGFVVLVGGGGGPPGARKASGSGPGRPRRSSRS